MKPLLTYSANRKNRGMKFKPYQSTILTTNRPGKSLGRLILGQLNTDRKNAAIASKRPCPRDSDGNDTDDPNEEDGPSSRWPGESSSATKDDSDNDSDDDNDDEDLEERIDPESHLTDMLESL